MPPRARPGPAGSIAASLIVPVLFGLSAIPTPRADAALARMLIPSSESIWRAFGTTPNEEFGSRVAGVGDVNGDGYGDVLIGAPSWSGAEELSGRVLLYEGSSTGATAEPAWILEGRQEAGYLGNAIAGAGDVNGDGYADVIVGEFGFSSGGKASRGRVRVFLGARQGLQMIPWWDLAGRSEGDELGYLVACAGDVNGDGLADVMVGGRSGTYLQLGRRGRPDQEVVWVGPRVHQFAGVGDVNRDGYDDVVLAGDLYLGSAAGLRAERAWRGPAAPAVSGGDVNGDGFADILLGPPIWDLQEVWLFYGSATGPSSVPGWIGTDPDFSSNYGLAASANGDVNGDGFADIVVASPGHNSHIAQQPAQPAVFVHLGGPGGPGSAPDWWGIDQTTRGSGWSLDMGSDADGDGASDLLVGEPSRSRDGTFPGGVLLYRIGRGYPAPRIEHEITIGAVPEGSPITLEASATDTTHFVAGVEIRFHVLEEADFRPPVSMEPIGAGRYRGTIPAGAVYGIGLVYSIRARDDFGLVGETELVGIDFYPPNAASEEAPKVRLTSSVPGRADGISFRTRRAGPARVAMYDVSGRRVRMLLDESDLPAGAHRVPLGLSGGGLAAGIYFYRVESVEGRTNGKILMMR